MMTIIIVINKSQLQSWKKSQGVLWTILLISPEVKVAQTHSKVRAILRRIFNSGVLHARLLIEKTYTRHNLKERVSGMIQISITLHTFLGTEKIT